MNNKMMRNLVIIGEFATEVSFGGMAILQLIIGVIVWTLLSGAGEIYP